MSNWTQGALARDEDENPVSPLSPNAVKWDLLGALIKANFEWHEEEEISPIGYESYHEVLAIMNDYAFDFEAGGNRDIEKWNDDQIESPVDVIAESRVWLRANGRTGEVAIIGSLDI